MPQVGALNHGAWKSLEEKCRNWADIDSAIIIVTGPILTDRITDYIGESQVAVPQRFFKVVLSPFSDPPRAIGFIMPNGKVPGGMQAAAVSVDEVEAATGYDFFSALPDDIENEIESQCKFHYWSTLKGNDQRRYNLRNIHAIWCWRYCRHTRFRPGINRHRRFDMERAWLADVPSHTVHLGTIIDDTSGCKEPLDQAVATIFRSPHSYTGENVVEFSVHGSKYVQRQLINL